MHCFLPLWQLDTNLGDFSNGVCLVTKMTTAKTNPDMGLLTQRIFCFSPISLAGDNERPVMTLSLAFDWASSCPTKKAFFLTFCVFWSVVSRTEALESVHQTFTPYQILFRWIQQLRLKPKCFREFQTEYCVLVVEFHRVGFCCFQERNKKILFICLCWFPTRLEIVNLLCFKRQQNGIFCFRFLNWAQYVFYLSNPFLAYNANYQHFWVSMMTSQLLLDSAA